eukprot:scaffold259249_cov13-Tisochrysis_lutea.AAC.1
MRKPSIPGIPFETRFLRVRGNSTALSRHSFCCKEREKASFAGSLHVQAAVELVAQLCDGGAIL